MNHTTDQSGVEACIAEYAEGMRSSRREPLERAFHPDATIAGPDDGALAVMDRERFITFVLNQAPEPALEAEVLNLEIDGAVASARVRDTYIGRVFIDHLALVLLDGRWQIYTKLWHVERRLA